MKQGGELLVSDATGSCENSKPLFVIFDKRLMNNLKFDKQKTAVKTCMGRRIPPYCCSPLPAERRMILS